MACLPSSMNRLSLPLRSSSATLPNVLPCRRGTYVDLGLPMACMHGSGQYLLNVYSSVQRCTVQSNKYTLTFYPNSPRTSSYSLHSFPPFSTSLGNLSSSCILLMLSRGLVYNTRLVMPFQGNVANSPTFLFALIARPPHADTINIAAHETFQ